MTYYFESAYEATRDITRGAFLAARTAVASATERVLAPIDERAANQLNDAQDEL